MSSIRKKLILFILIFAASSCFKQDTPEVQSDYEISAQDEQRLQSCSVMSLTDNLLNSDNLRNLFVCTRWSEQFPEIFKALSNIDGNKWNFLFSPFNSRIFNNEKKLNRLISLTNELDRQNGLDDLGKVISALSDTNFYDSLNALFLCSENSKEANCSERNIVSRESLVKMIASLHLKEDDIDKLLYLFSRVVEIIEPEKEKLRLNFLEVYDSEEFKKKRIKLLDGIIYSFSEEKTDQEKDYFRKIIQGTDQSFSQFLSRSSNRQAIIEITKKMSRNDNLFLKDIKASSIVSKRNLSCKLPNKDLRVLSENYIETYLNKFSESDFNNSMSFLLDEVAIDVYAKKLCPDIYSQKTVINYGSNELEHSLNILKFKKQMAEIFDSNTEFGVAKYFINTLLASRSNSGFSTKLIFDMFSRSFFESLHVLNSVVVKNNDILLDQMMWVLGNFDKNDTEVFLEVYDRLSSIEYTSQFESFLKIWRFFTENEKSFLFNYVDRHLKEDADYVLLFKYYIEILNILKSDIDFYINDYLAENSNKIVESMQEVASFLAGEKILKEFRLFFSREHIIKIMKLLSNPGQIDEQVRAILAQRQFNSVYSPNNYVLRTDPKFKECISQMSELNFERDRLIKVGVDKLCPEVETQGMLTLFTWFNSIDHELAKIKESNQLVGDKGLFSPYLALLTAANLKIINNSLISNKSDWNRAIEKIKDYFFVNKLGQSTLKSFLNFIIELNQDEESSKNRESLYKLMSNSSFQDSLSKTTARLPLVIQEFNDFQMPQGYYDIGDQPQEYSCEQYNNLIIGGEPCPKADVVANLLKDSVLILTRSSDADHTAIFQYINAFNVDYGLQIPYKSKNPTKKNLTLFESAKMFYETTDKSKEINNKLTKYIDKDFKKNEIPMTIMERIESVIREVRFDSNYLGAHYKNAVSKSEDYNKTVKNKKTLFSACSKLMFCGKFMNKDERRMGKNAVSTFDGLLEVNKDGLEYGDYMKALLMALVSSSKKSSQISSIINVKIFGKRLDIPWLQTKKQLKGHNGKFLINVALMSSFSNVSRVLKDRLGRTPDQYEKFLNSKDLQFLSNELLKNTNPSTTEKYLQEIMGDAVSVQNSDGETLIDYAVKNIANLDYNALRVLENTLLNSLIVFHYLGPIRSKNIQNFESNSLDDLLFMASKLVKHWPVFIKILPEGFELMNALKVANKVSYFLKKKLHSDSENLYYEFVNNMFKSLKDILLYDEDLKLLDSFLSNPERNTQNLYEVISSSHEFLKDNKEFLSDVSYFVQYFNEPQLELRPYSVYFDYVSIKNTCSNSTDCANPHYDEPFNLLKIFNANYDDAFLNISKNSDKINQLFQRSLNYFELEANTP